MPSLKRLIYFKYQWFETRLSNELTQLGVHPRTPAQAQILMALNGGSRTISDVARQIGVSRQAAHKTINELIKDGWLQTRTGDKRHSKIVELTPYGVAQRNTVVTAMRNIEKEIASSIGTDNLALLKKLLSQPW